MDDVLSPTSLVERGIEQMSLTQSAHIPIPDALAATRTKLFVSSGSPGARDSSLRRRKSNQHHIGSVDAYQRSALRRSSSSRQKRKSVCWHAETTNDIEAQLVRLNHSAEVPLTVDSLASHHQRALVASHKSPKRAKSVARDLTNQQQQQQQQQSTQEQQKLSFGSNNSNTNKSAKKHRSSASGRISKSRNASGQAFVDMMATENIAPAGESPAPATPKREVSGRGLFGAGTPRTGEQSGTPVADPNNGNGDFFSPYKPPPSRQAAKKRSNAATFRRSVSTFGSQQHQQQRDGEFAVPALPRRDGEPRAKRRPKSCFVKPEEVPLSESSGEFVRNDPLDALHQLQLPCKLEEGMNVIPSSVLAGLLTGRYADRFDRVVVIDCRFAYEFDGGHIKDAFHVPTEMELYSLLQRKPPLENGERTCVIFHCEFSSHRGPNMYRALRSWDRKQHHDCYPQLYYPELYLLKGGYKKFYQDCIQLCEPQAYQPMFDRKYKQEMRSGLCTTKHRKQRRSMSMNDISDHRDLRRSLKW